MKNSVFDKLVEAVLDRCKAVLCSKKDEYATEVDRLHNFKVAGRMVGCSDIKALDGMWLKHRVSIQDIVDKMESDPGYCPSEELVAEKLGDNINYTLLLWGLIADRRRELIGNEYNFEVVLEGQAKDIEELEVENFRLLNENDDLLAQNKVLRSGHESEMLSLKRVIIQKEKERLLAIEKQCEAEEIAKRYLEEG